MRLYDRGHPVKPSEQSVHVGSSQVNNHITGDEDERLSTNSVDSEGTISMTTTVYFSTFNLFGQDDLMNDGILNHKLNSY